MKKYGGLVVNFSWILLQLFKARARRTVDEWNAVGGGMWGRGRKESRAKKGKKTRLTLQVTSGSMYSGTGTAMYPERLTP